MNIAVVYQHYYPEPFRLTDICEELVKRGHTVTVYTGLPNYPHGNIPKKYKMFKNRLEYRNGVKIVRTFEIGRKKGKLGLALNYLSYTISSVWKSIFAPLDFDVIFAYSTSPILMSLPGIVLKKRSGKKLLLYIMDVWPACLSAMNVKETDLLYKFMKKVSKFVYSRCDMLTYSSRAFKTYSIFVSVFISYEICRFSKASILKNSRLFELIAFLISTKALMIFICISRYYVANAQDFRRKIS